MKYARPTVSVKCITMIQGVAAFRRVSQLCHIALSCHLSLFELSIHCGEGPLIIRTLTQMAYSTGCMHDGKSSHVTSLGHLQLVAARSREMHIGVLQWLSLGMLLNHLLQQLRIHLLPSRPLHAHCLGLQGHGRLAAGAHCKCHNMADSHCGTRESNCCPMHWRVQGMG